MVQQKQIQLVSMRMRVQSIPALAQWVSKSCVAMSCGIGRRQILDPALLWLWLRPVTMAPIQTLAWELTCTTGVSLKKHAKKVIIFISDIFFFTNIKMYQNKVF